MQTFTQLLSALSRAADDAGKLEALTRYFGAAEPADAAWALYLLTGRRLPRSASAAELRRWAGEASGCPEWLIELSVEAAAGDASEALALVLAASAGAVAAPRLQALIEERLLPLKDLADAERRAAIMSAWGEFDSPGRILWNKLLAGEFRGGPGRGPLIRALAGVAGVAPAEMAHRLEADWPPTAAGYRHLIAGDHTLTSPGEPYPFYFASLLEGAAGSLGPRAGWLAEWHWDGLRAQLIRRRGQVLLWSRDEELLTGLCPEVAGCAALPEGTALDGVLLAWRGGAPLPLEVLRRRLARKHADRKIMEEIPLVFMAFDLLEAGGRDLREAPLAERRVRLEELLNHAGGEAALRVSPPLGAESWGELDALRGGARARGARGLILKRLDSPYRAGRVSGDWWKWPAPPHGLLAVLLYATRAQGGRAGNQAQFSLGVWSGGLLVPVARVEARLPEAELDEIESFIRANTVERHGPVRVVRQELVFEVEFEAVQPSARHKAGLTLREPRLTRWRRDLLPGQAGELESLRKMI